MMTPPESKPVRLLFAALLVLAACSKAGEDPRPNVLLVLADDLGYADLGAYGGSIATPGLDRLAREGMRFTSFYANGPICSPTRVSILTGRYPQRFGLYGGVSVDSSWGLPDDAVTMPRLLSGAGYETRHVGKWHLGHAEERFWPTAHGFDGFFGFLHAHHLPKTYHDPRLRRDDGPEAPAPGHLTDLLTTEAESFLRQRPGDGTPFFLHVWYFSPHKPLEPPKRWAERYPDTVEGRYGAMVSALDENVGRLLKALDETGLADDTVVLFLSDNGGARDVRGGDNGPLRGGKNQLYEGGLRVPLIVRWPGRVAAEATTNSLTATFDLLPTIADLAGVRLDDVPVDGRVLTPLLRGADDDYEGPLFWEDIHSGKKRFAVRKGPWKLLSEGGRTLLYDLGTDLSERVDLATDRPEIVDELLMAHRQWRAGL